jgi:(1->4)-alpha-D-glucan 1-alpha-D-glucosylmutase
VQDEPGTLKIPSSTYRLQFNRSFTFIDASGIVPYLSELGITDIYSSPYLKARPGSLHGYDIINYEELNPEVGTEEEYDLFTAELARSGMGQIADIVPNHMCILGENRWWKDVLENGKSSPFAYYFDIDWNYMRESLKEKVLLPILGRQYGRALESGEIRLDFTNGTLYANYFEHCLPIEPTSYELILKKGLDTLEEKLAGTPELEELMSILTGLAHLPPANATDPEKMRERQREKEVIKRRLAALSDSSPEVKNFILDNIESFNGKVNDPRSFDRMDDLLSRQPYRISLWKVAAEEINYRRFFDINELAAIRMEVPEVFNASHKLIFKFIGEGRISGLRVDHPDGLFNPSGYLKKLQHEAASAGSASNVDDPPPSPPAGEAQTEALSAGAQKNTPYPFYIVGEKILMKGEKLPEDWPIYGTTGYGFMNILNGIFIRTENAALMDETYSRFIKRKPVFSELLYEKKKLIMESSMAAEINVLGYKLGALAEKSRLTRDFTFLSLTKALIEIIACFPVYRSYTSAFAVNERDRRYIEAAVRRAKRMNTSLSADVLDFIKSVLLLDFPEGLKEENRGDWLDFVMRFQQHTGPVMAKGLEDTAFYDYNRLLSLNEVGGAPDRFGYPLETFQAQNSEAARSRPYSMNATSTHDSKRSGDVRARLNVLTEMPREWRENVLKWARLNRKTKKVLDGTPCPDANEEYHLYQTLLGIWPLEGQPDAEFMERVKEYMIKALRESKVNTSWISMDSDYERAVLSFIESILRPDTPFFKEIDRFAKDIAWYGMLNALSQVLLKIASPGVPDFYQGTELWSFHLVDPDNRKKVDYGLRAGLLKELKEKEERMGASACCETLLESMSNGKIKLYLTWKALNFRKENRELFLGGQYVPLQAEGPFKGNICAFMKKGSGSFICVAPRFLKSLTAQGEFPIGESVWGDTRLFLPEGSGFKNIFTEGEARIVEEDGKKALYVKDLFSEFPYFLGPNID